MGKIGCCFECERKTLCCHANCEDYIKETRQRKLESEMKRKANLSNSIFHTYGCPGRLESSTRKSESSKPLRYYARGKR